MKQLKFQLCYGKGSNTTVHYRAVLLVLNEAINDMWQV